MYHPAHPHWDLEVATTMQQVGLVGGKNVVGLR